MLAVSLPQSQTSRSPPATADKSPWQTGQRVLFRYVNGGEVHVAEVADQQFTLQGWPTPAKQFYGFHSLQAPITPGVAPITPRVLQVSKSLSERLGIKHSKQPVSGGANTERLPSMPMAAPNT